MMRKRVFLKDDNTLTLYMKEIGKTKSLTQAEEADLAKRIRANDMAALHQMVRANLKFVVSVCRHFQNQGLPLSDLINEGNIGLVQAAWRFDETKKFKFISYAVWWIRQAIIQALMDKSRLIKLPSNRVNTLHKIGKTHTRLEQKLGRTPSSEEISAYSQVEISDVEENARIAYAPLSLDGFSSDGQESSLLDILYDEREPSPEEQMLEKDLKSEIRQALDTLPKKESTILKMYYGIDMETPFTLVEIGIRVNLTRERVRQIKETALRKLRRSGRSRGLNVYA